MSSSSSESISSMEEAVGLSDPNTAHQRRAMLDLINRLRTTGVQRDIDLPMIAVVGNQSAGKSSLIESISGITLPRSSGTCTRCPTECKLVNADISWTCIVKLHFITNEGRPRIIPFGDAIASKADVEERIRRAQRAILNPRKEPDSFLHGADVASGEYELSFSRSYVSLEISGRELADLSFVDLPGLIASVGNAGNDNDIDLVKNLVVSYIERPSCVILLTVACETDFENQGAHHLVKQFDPEGKRTVGVLTKPDRIPLGEEESWLRLIRNETEPLANNWFCVKQPSSHTLAQGITWAEARRQESEFFAGTQPWRHLDSHYQMFLRTANLTERLSAILAELIAKRLPEIQDEIYNVVMVAEHDLRQLPGEPPGDPIAAVLQVFECFKTDLAKRLEGTPDENGIIQRIRTHAINFKLAIHRTAPQFMPWELKESGHRSFPLPPFIKDDVDDVHLPRNNIYLDEVVRRAQNARARELPDNYPFVVQKTYIMGIIGKWQQPAMVLFNAVYDILKENVEELVDRHFAQMGRGSSKQVVLMIALDHLDAAAARTKSKIEWLLNLEKEPTTFNTHYYSEYRGQFLAHYKACRDTDGIADVIASPHDYEVNNAIAALAAIGLNVTPDDLPKLLPPDPKEAALGIMASVCAYFQVAYKRFVDIVPLAIDYEAVRGLERGLHDALVDGLQLTSDNAHTRCAAMFQESTAIACRRAELLKKLERLRAARQELRRLSV